MPITITADALAQLTRLLVKSVQAEISLHSESFELECIRRLRYLTGLGPKDARDLVEAALPTYDAVLEVASALCDH